jgi:hypothetical protein
LTRPNELVFDQRSEQRTDVWGLTMGTMRILDHTGDTTIAWSVDDPESIAKAERVFDRLARERKIPFARGAGAPANEAERIRTFDPTADEILWVRPVAGG